MEKSVVSIADGIDPNQVVENALDLLGGVNSLIKPGSVVVVKPNAGHNYPPETSVCTSPEVVAATIKVLRKAKPREIILAEASAIGSDTQECLKVSGIAKAAEEAGVDKIIDIKKEKDLIKIPIRRAKSAITSIKLPKWLVEADHIVNLPIFKPHSSMLYTCALKNIKGLVQDKVHYQMHQTDLALAMGDVWSVLQADLSIADMMRPAEGFGPHNTVPVDFGCIVASKDPVALDSTACRMAGVEIEKIHYLKTFYDRGLGNYENESIEVRGKKIDDVFMPLWFPFLGGFEQWPEYKIYADGACSSCQALIAFTMEWLKAIGQYENNAGISIVAGRTKELPKVDDPKDLILVGDCVKKFKGKGIFGSGCPPVEAIPLMPILERRSMESLMDMIGTEDPVEMQKKREESKGLQDKFVEYAYIERDKFAKRTHREKRRGLKDITSH